MKWNIRTITVFLGISIASFLGASEKRKLESISQDTVADQKFHGFQELLPELQEKIIREYIYDLLKSSNHVNCYHVNCYRKAKELHETLTTSKYFYALVAQVVRKMSQHLHIENPELCYIFEIVKLVVLKGIHEQRLTADDFSGFLPASPINSAISGRLGSFHAFGELFPEIQKRIIEEYIYAGLNACKSSDDFKRLYRSLSTSRDFKQWSLRALEVIARKAELVNPELYHKCKMFQQNMLVCDYIPDSTMTMKKFFSLLTRAQKDKNVKIVVQLINCQAAFCADHYAIIDVNEKDENGDTILLWACKYGCAHAVSRLIAIEHSEFNTSDHHGFTPLMYAVLSGNEKLVKNFLKVPGIGINARDEWGWTALMVAISCNYTALVKELLTIDGIDTDGSLLAAVRYKRLEILKMLRSIPGVKVNAQLTGKGFGRTALMEALYNRESDAWFGEREKYVREIFPTYKLDYDFDFIALDPAFDFELVNILLSSDEIEIDFVDDYGNNALIEATKRGNEDIVKKIIECGARLVINHQNRDGITALIQAVRDGHYSIVKLLLQVPEIDLNVRDSRGCTALFYAMTENFSCFSDARRKIFHLLLANKGIDVNKACVRGALSVTPLMEAAANGDIESVELLLQNPEIDVHVTFGGQNALTFAMNNGHFGICELLRERGAHVPKRGD